MKWKKAFLAFNEALKDEETEVTMTDGVLADGTVIRWEGELAEGVAVLKITEEGEVSLEDGQFTLEDGTSIEVKGGLVAVVVPAEIEEEVEEEMNEFDSDKFKQEISEMIDAKVSAAIEGLEFASKEDVNAMTEKLSSQVEAMGNAVMEAFEKIEQPKPTKPTKNNIVEERVEKAVAMAAALRKNK